jgi:hypothetical protein
MGRTRGAPRGRGCKAAPIVDRTFERNGKTYPYKDPKTGELLYREPISFAPSPELKRQPLTKLVNLLEHQPPRIESGDGFLGRGPEYRLCEGGFRWADNGFTHIQWRIFRSDSAPHSINHPHGFNVVNLHTHGLNVSPEDTCSTRR